MAALNEISANQVDVPHGKAVYTQWCNDQGGIESDLTVTRLGDDQYLVVTAAAASTRDLAWLRKGCRGHDVMVTDITDEMSMFGVMGPNSRALLSQMTTADMSNEAFPFGTAQHIEVAGIEVLAMRMTYEGELGWELYVATGDAPALYDVLFAAGRPLGLRHAGYHAMNSLRLEAGYRHWGHDITDQDTPVEAGLGFAVAWDKPSFRGRDAVLAQRDRPRIKRLIQFRVEHPEILVNHDEPIYRDGVLVGSTSSGMWSYTQERCLAMGYVHADGGVDQEWLDGGTFEVQVGTHRLPLTPSVRSFYDPRNQRVRM
jgi:4-methylaminobutanoate oxidase (formaldehyde-forming)